MWGSGNVQCYTGYCNAGTTCNCPLALTTAKCDCNHYQFYQDDQSTDPSYSCVTRYSYADTCKFHYQCGGKQN